jgi:hypothetical protein
MCRPATAIQTTNELIRLIRFRFCCDAANTKRVIAVSEFRSHWIQAKFKKNAASWPRFCYAALRQ